MSASSQVTRTERLLNLVIALLAAHTPVSRQVVQSSVAGYDPTATTTAFERMFERDKDELRSMGIPIETVTDAHGEVLGYLIDTSEYVHRDVTFDADELMALNLAALVWDDAILSATATTAVRKLESTGTIASLAPDAKAIPAFAHVSASDAALLPLMRAVRDRKVVRFSYRKPGADESTRRVDPWSLHAEGGRWYLTGWDHERTSARTFRVSRIEGSVTLTAESTTT
ncbi:MAG: WYL domain-containing protein, partial [Actinomycetota bacterium]|nr:WYL domain-containing protein [Actinomycetota bacterium]